MTLLCCYWRWFCFWFSSLLVVALQLVTEAAEHTNHQCKAAVSWAWDSPLPASYALSFHITSYHRVFCGCQKSLFWWSCAVDCFSSGYDHCDHMPACRNWPLSISGDLASEQTGHQQNRIQTTTQLRTAKEIFRYMICEEYAFDRLFPQRFTSPFWFLPGQCKETCWASERPVWNRQPCSAWQGEFTFFSLSASGICRTLWLSSQKPSCAGIPKTTHAQAIQNAICCEKFANFIIILVLSSILCSSHAVACSRRTAFESWSKWSTAKAVLFGTLLFIVLVQFLLSIKGIQCVIIPHPIEQVTSVKAAWVICYTRLMWRDFALTCHSHVV